MPLVVLVVGLAGGGGCFLSARTPEAPQSQNQVPFINPTSMAIVLQNVQVTFAAKSVNNYQRSLDPSFTFVPDPADATESGNPILWQNWNMQQEVQVFTQILNLPEAVTLSFSWPNSTGLTELSTDQPNVYYYKDLQYNMTLFHASKDTIFSGKADLYMKETNGSFAITEWLDKRDGSPHATLGLVRWKGSIQF